MPRLRLCCCHAGSARCRISSLSSSGSLPSWSAVAPWPALLPVYPTFAGLNTVPAGTRKPYLRRVSALCFVLALSVLAVCLGGVSALMSSATVACCARGGSSVLGPPIGLSSPPLAPYALVARVVGGFWYPPRSRPSSLGPPSLGVVPLGVLYPQGNSITPGVSAPCGDSTPLPLHGGTPVSFPPL